MTYIPKAKWHQEGFNIINEDNECIAVCLTEGIAHFIVNIANPYWEHLKKEEEKYKELMRKLGI